MAATTGLLRRLSSEEAAGVMAHELAHVKNRDTLTMTITATIAGAVGMLANFGLFFGGSRNNPLGIVGVLLMAILAPMAAALVQMAISRSREYEADRIGAEICGQPLWLASALEKIQAAAGQIDNQPAERNPATAHMFIINPAPRSRGRQPVLNPPEHGQPRLPPAPNVGRDGRPAASLGLSRRRSAGTFRAPGRAPLCYTRRP